MRVIVNIIATSGLVIFVCIISSLIVRDFRNKKHKESVIANGVDTQAVITNYYSRSGGGSGFVNVTLTMEFRTENGEDIIIKKDSVINSMDVNKYQPGSKVKIRYYKADPKKIIVDISNPLDLRK
ncbi:DUF3592 domain-containing protein [Pantoea ananatis]|uniref:DUF3592 domain-containing protein n=1 Tax=Pantoea ananas TaxID=553 RepID=UPI0021E7EE15|nr:DUF3592 domain-containing protein [Pantoea ananatis]UYL00970.1 DUF3592 domain-containing protein [Pantoea ananatis]